MIWYLSERGRGKNTKRGCRLTRNLTILHFKTRKEDHQTPEKRDDQDGLCIILQKT